MPEFLECNWVEPHTQTKTNLAKCLCFGVLNISLVLGRIILCCQSQGIYVVQLAVWLFMLVTSELSDSVAANFLPCHVRVLDRVNSNICFVNYMNNTHIYTYIYIYSRHRFR